MKRKKKLITFGKNSFNDNNTIITKIMTKKKLFQFDVMARA